MRGAIGFSKIKPFPHEKIETKKTTESFIIKLFLPGVVLVREKVRFVDNLVKEVKIMNDREFRITK